MEAGGIERNLRGSGDHAQAGRCADNPGQNRSQPGHGAGDTSDPSCKSRTVPGQIGTKAGRREATTSAEREQSNRITKMCDFPSDLRAVIAAWPRLPEAIRAAIGAMVGVVEQEG